MTWTPNKKRKLSITPDKLPTARQFETYFRIHQTAASIFHKNNKAKLKKDLLSFYNCKFNYWEDGKDCKIFYKDNIMYYCSTWNDYAALDILTGKVVARAILENDWLQTIDVDENYRRRKIGSNLMKAIVKTLGNNFHIPSRGTLGITSYYLTTEGAALINYCLDKGIVKDEQCMLDVPPRTPPSSPNHS
jgi:hypothetical protein